MPVPLENYTVREAGIVSYDTLKSVANKYGTTAQALKYLNRSDPEVMKLKTGEGLAFASKIDPNNVPILKVPQSVTGGSSTNQQAGSVSRTTYTPMQSKRIILKRINANYGTALGDNISFLRDKSGWEYLHSASNTKYHYWDPLYSLLADVYPLLQRASDPALTDAQRISLQRDASNTYSRYTNFYAKVLRLKDTEVERINYFQIADQRNNTQTPPDSDKDKREVLKIIEKIVDLDAPNDSYGHWWLEIYKSDISLLPQTVKDSALYPSVFPSNLKASYGFWPLESAGLGSGAVYGSVPGGINNKRSSAGGNIINAFDINDANCQFDPYTNDNYISWKVNNAYFVTDPYGRLEDEIYNDILEYLRHYPADRHWAWPDTSEDEEHCQSFQKELLAACGLVAMPEIPKEQFPPLDKYKLFWGSESLP